MKFALDFAWRQHGCGFFFGLIVWFIWCVFVVLIAWFVGSLGNSLFFFLFLCSWQRDIEKDQEEESKIDSKLLFFSPITKQKILSLSFLWFFFLVMWQFLFAPWVQSFFENRNTTMICENISAPREIFTQQNKNWRNSNIIQWSKKKKRAYSCICDWVNNICFCLDTENCPQFLKIDTNKTKKISKMEVSTDLESLLEDQNWRQECWQREKIEVKNSSGSHWTKVLIEFQSCHGHFRLTNLIVWVKNHFNSVLSLPINTRSGLQTCKRLQIGLEFVCDVVSFILECWQKIVREKIKQNKLMRSQSLVWTRGTSLIQRVSFSFVLLGEKLSRIRNILTNSPCFCVLVFFVVVIVVIVVVASIFGQHKGKRTIGFFCSNFLTNFHPPVLMPVCFASHNNNQKTKKLEKSQKQLIKVWQNTLWQQQTKSLLSRPQKNMQKGIFLCSLFFSFFVFRVHFGLFCLLQFLNPYLLPKKRKKSCVPDITQAKWRKKGDYILWWTPFATGLPHYRHILAGTVKVRKAKKRKNKTTNKPLFFVKTTPQDVVTRSAHPTGHPRVRRFG